MFYKKTSQFSEVPREGDYEALVEAKSRMLAVFSQEVADILKVRSPSTTEMFMPGMKETTPLR